MLTESGMVDIQHIWTREIKSLPIEYFDRRIIRFRWSLAGCYDLHLQRNVLVGKRLVVWRAHDIRSLRRLVFAHFRCSTEEEMAESMKRHNDV
jgi:hypothetical protein